MVPDHLMAWHARRHNNEWLSVELVQPTIQDYFYFAQYEALAELLVRWSHMFDFPLIGGVIGHEDVDSRKSDPGPKFLWGMLSESIMRHGL